MKGQHIPVNQFHSTSFSDFSSPKAPSIDNRGKQYSSLKQMAKLSSDFIRAVIRILQQHLTKHGS